MQYILLCRSMSAAQRASRSLQDAGIFASVTKAPQRANPGGCTYGVKIGARNLEAAIRILRENRVEVKKVFSYALNGEIAEVAL